jgi:hypothetical protein
MSVIAFCERHSLSNMLNLLRHSGPSNHMQEVFALNVLEELVKDDADKSEALRCIRAEIHPVERAARLRAQKIAQTADINHKKNVTLAALHLKIADLEEQLAKKREEHAKPQAADETQHAQPPMDEDETQAGDVDDTQPIFTNTGDDSSDTQPDNMHTEQDLLLKKK